MSQELNDDDVQRIIDETASLDDEANVEEVVEEELETEEEREEREAEEAKAEREKRIRIPKARFDEAVGRERSRADAAERELDRLRNEQQVRQDNAPTRDQVLAYIDELESKYEDLLIEGERDDARKVRAQIRQANDYLSDMRIKQATSAIEEQTYSVQSYEKTLNQIEALYPQLQYGTDTFDMAAAEEIADLVKTFAASGQSTAQALVRATRYVLGEPTRGQAGQQRVEEARRRNAGAALRQPSSTARSGRGSAPASGIDINNLSQEAFNKIDEKTLSKLRGDDI